MKLEPIVKTFYDNLENGILMGRRCLECGNIEFPPHPACNACGYRDTEWCELSGDGEVIDFVLPGTMGARPNLDARGDYAYGTVRLAEGPTFKCVIFGIGADNAQDVRDHLPLPVRPRIEHEEPGNYPALYFQLA